MAYTKMINKDGKEVSPTSATFQAAAAKADWAHAPAFYQILTDQPGAQSWPITSATFILLPKQTGDAAATSEVLSSSSGPSPMAARWRRILNTFRFRPLR